MLERHELQEYAVKECPEVQPPGPLRQTRADVPVGGGVGRLFTVGSPPINIRVEAFDNVHRPDGAPSRQTQLQVAFLFPQH
jgi:hypothetical protein